MIIANQKKYLNTAAVHDSWPIWGASIAKYAPCSACAATEIVDDRGEIRAEIERLICNTVDSNYFYNIQFQLTDIDFDDEFELAIREKQQNINRYVHAYFSDHVEVMMELKGIDLMFSNQEVMPMPVKEYREYMKERKKEAKAKGDK